jgi:hypothetical protein
LGPVSYSSIKRKEKKKVFQRIRKMVPELGITGFLGNMGLIV